MISVRLRGFTLIELMIVIAIIGILSSIAIPQYQDYVIRSEIVEAFSMSDSLKPAILDYYKFHGTFPANNQAAGIPAPKYLIGNFVTGITVSDGAITVEFGNKVTKDVKGRLLSVRPLVVIGSPTSPIDWNCGHATAPNGMQAIGVNKTTLADKYLPAICR
ncbi:MAG TPA: pilin [Gammaproteobacteria bacterium]|nr:pilin [Gammaproteobacteria bacterium]